MKIDERVEEILKAAMGDEGDMIHCFEVNSYTGEIPQTNEAKHIELIRLALVLLQKSCPECGYKDIELIVELDTNFHIGNHKPCLVPLWKCKRCSFRYFDDVLGDIASKIIIANEHL